MGKNPKPNTNNNDSTQPTWITEHHADYYPSDLNEYILQFTGAKPQSEEATNQTGNKYRIYRCEVRDKSGKLYILRLFKSQLDRCVKLQQQGKAFQFVTATDPLTKKQRTITVDAQI